MYAEYIVCTEEGYRSSNDKDEQESFTTFRKAEKRAKELAEVSPGQPIRIYELVAETSVPTGVAVTGRKYPIEHYK